MNIRFRAEGLGETSRRLAALGTQAPKALAVAMNRTGEQINSGLRRQMQSRFTIRVPIFLPPVQLPRDDRADERRGKLTAEVILYDQPTGFRAGKASGGEGLAQRRGAILSKFESGETKRRDSQGGVAIPTKRIRPTPLAKIPAQLLPKNLRLVLDRREVDGSPLKAKLTRRLGQGKKLTALGLNGRTYFTATRRGTFGVYERLARGSGGPRLVWAVRPSVRIPAILGFYQVAQAVTSRRLKQNLDEAVAFYVGVAMRRGA